MSVKFAYIGLNTQAGREIQNRFVLGWKGDAADVPDVHAIYYILYESQTAGYSQSVAHNAYISSIQKQLLSNDVQKYLFYSADRACNLGDSNKDLKVCSLADCTLCLNLKNLLSMERTSFFGKGVYTTAHSSKATADTKNLHGQSQYKVVVNCDVVVGKTKLLDAKDPSLTKPPDGYQSVQSNPLSRGSPFTHPETVVYNTAAALPIALIVITPPPDIDPFPTPLTAEDEISQICESSGGRSQFFGFGTSGYKDSVRHFFVSSAEVATSAVQPGTVEDVSKIMTALVKWDVPFAIKGGGHATSPKFSSTTGIQIYMCKFDQVKYDPVTATVDVGAGCLWDHVYTTLAKDDRGVVGGATMGGVGVAGYLLGGGYSLKTNQFGLGIDNIVKFEVVVPDGRILVVGENDSVHKDLFEALKGGGSNFGIVTRFTLKTHPQGSCWSFRSSLEFEESESNEVKTALVNFAQNEKRPQAAIVGTFRHYYESHKLKSDIDVFCFYDGILPTGTDDPFAEFKAIKQAVKPAGAQQDDPASSGAQASFQEVYDRFVKRGSPAVAMGGVGEIGRGRFACIMVTGFTRPLVDEMEKQIKESANSITEKGGTRLLLDVWPFLPTIFDNSTPAAWPHKKGEAVSPLLAFYTWEDEKDDDFWVGEMKRALGEIQTVAKSEGCMRDDAPIYLNTTLGDTPVKDIYGENYSKLARIKAQYDRHNTMRNAGGFVIPIA